MKTTLLLILLAITLNAQGIFYQDDDGDILKVDVVINERYLSESFIKLFDEYSKECWADSSYNKYNYFINGGDTTYGSIGMIDPGIYSDYKGIIGIWSHREPTFKGFIEFLRRKIE